LASQLIVASAPRTVLQPRLVWRHYATRALQRAGPVVSAFQDTLRRRESVPGWHILEPSLRDKLGQDGTTSAPGSHSSKNWPGHSTSKATHKPSTSHQQAINLGGACDPQATPKPHECRLKARYMRGTSHVLGRELGGASQVHAWYMRGTSHANAGGRRGR